MPDPLTAKLVAAIESRYETYLDDLRTLTAIDSPSGHKPGLDEMGAFLRRRFEDLGGQIEVHENAHTGDDVVGRFHGSGDRKILMLCHTDTVYPVGTAAARPLRIEGNRALAPGICDMKAGILTAIYSVAALSETGWDDYASINFVCNSDEETVPRHSIGLIQDEAGRADAVFCMEAARVNGNLVSSRKGVMVLKLAAEGRESHAGVAPDQGRNAIVPLADKLVEIWRLNGKYPGMTVSPGLIQGGTSSNTVPGQATASIDVRVTRQQDMAAVEADIGRILEGPIVPDVRLSFHHWDDMPPMENTAGTKRLVELAKQAANEIGFEVEDTATGGGSDGAYAAAVGTPVLDGLGPIGGAAHSEREYLELASIVPRTAMLARLLTLV